jgi:hypothetical protein
MGRLEATPIDWLSSLGLGGLGLWGGPGVTTQYPSLVVRARGETFVQNDGSLTVQGDDVAKFISLATN